ncbi:ATP-binding cassette domain-containing protein, partial [Enterococcus faecalis]|nr:ATP-binding cassette domain-containing protein [Enterococcus faecalis]
VTFEHVGFAYDPKKPLIKDLNFEVKAGQTVAIVGPTGAGKTTLINLLMRFYDVNEGAIKIDGIDTKKMERHDVRSLFGMV